MTVAVPRSRHCGRHLIHVAFNNRIESSEKRIDGRQLPRFAGRVVGRSMILPAGCELWGWTTGEVDYLGLELDPALIESAAKDAGHRQVASLKPQVQVDDPVLWHLACALRAEMALGQPGGRLFQDGVQLSIARHLTTVHLGLPTAKSSLSSGGALSIVQLRRIREFVRENLHRDLRLSDMAEVVGLSTFHFARAFKLTAGVAPYRFLLEERLVIARRLLECTDLSVGEIARSAGFESLTGFGAAFRRRFGIAPSQYRHVVRG